MRNSLLNALNAEASRPLRIVTALVVAALAPMGMTRSFGRGRAASVAAGAAMAMSQSDRVYAAEQFSNTVSVTDPMDNRLLGVIRLGDPEPQNLSPLYRGQRLVHGIGVSPDHRTLAVVSIGTNSVSFIETATNSVTHVTYVGRAPHEASFTPDGNEVWVAIRGESHIAVLDGHTYQQKTRIEVPEGPGMLVFSPDGRYAYVCSSFTPLTVVLDVSDHRVVGRVKQESSFCPDIAVTPDGHQVWLTLKDVGRTMVFDAHPPFDVLKTIVTGPLTNDVNFALTANGLLAYVSVGGFNEVQAFRTNDFAKVASILVGELPHGLWASRDGSRLYVGLENGGALSVINTRSNREMTRIPIGQAPQAIAFVADAVPIGDGKRGLEPLGASGEVVHLSLVAVPDGHPAPDSRPPTSVSLFDQGVTQVVQAAVTGLEPRGAYVLALSARPNGGGALLPLAAFTANSNGAAIVNAIAPVRQLVQATDSERRYLVIVGGTPSRLGAAVQIQKP
jgi:YVTN family beta-propeller protein